DASNEHHEDLIEQVNDVLVEIGAEQIPCLRVYNKIDLLSEDRVPLLERNHEGQPSRVWISARTGAGLDLLRSAISELLGEDVVESSLHLSPMQGRLRARLYARGAVRGEHTESNGDVSLDIRLPRHDLTRLLVDEGITGESVGLIL